VFNVGVTTRPFVPGSSIYPAALNSGLTMNWNPPNLATAGIIYATNTGAGTSTLSGLFAGSDGDLVLLVIRDAPSTFIIAQEDGNSLALNRFNFTLTFSFGRGGVWLRYDGALARWTRLWSAIA